MTSTAPPNSAERNSSSADGGSEALNERVRQMLTASPAITYTTKATGNCACTFVSENLHSILGFKPGEMIADPKHWPDNLHPQDAPRVVDSMPALIEHGGGVLEYRFRHHDGHYIWIQDTFRVLRDDAGQPVEVVGVWADITERKVAQDALQRSHYELEKRIDARVAELKAGQQRLEYVLAVSPAITYATNATNDFTCTFASESSRQIMGYSPQEALAQPDFWISHLHPQDAPQVIAEFARLIPQGGGHLEYRFLHKGGHYRWFQDTFQVLHDAEGHPTEIVGSWADITHRKLAEAVRELYSASLERQEPVSLEKLDNILDTGREVLQLDRLSIMRADPRRQWLQAIATTCKEEPLESIRVPIDAGGGGLAHAFLTKRPLVWNGKSPVPDHLRLHPPYNQIKALRSRVYAIVPLIVQEQPIGVLAADRKHNRVPFEPATLDALNNLAKQAALALEHARIYAAAQPVLSRSLNLSVVYPAFARAVKALLPYDRIGVIVPEGQHLVMALSAAEPPLASWQGHSWPQAQGTAIDWVLKNKKPRVARDMREEREFPDSAFVAKEGVRSNLTVPLLVGQNAVGAFFLDSVISNAYTERDIELVDPVAQQLALAIDNTRLFQEVEAKGRQLEVANNHKSQFLAHVSHELRTPLNAILGYTELILDGIYGEVPEKIRAIMQRVEANSRHLLSLINDVLDLSKIDAGSLTLINSDYSMEETVRAAASNVASLAAAKHLALKIELAPSLPRARGDERRIMQVLLNLLGNAIKFTDRGEVTLKVDSSEHAFHVSVTDTGSGIEDSEREQIFQEFHQGDTARISRKGGSGLGLPISKRFIELHGGQIGVNSTPGKGSTFWFSLPIRAEEIGRGG